MKNDYERKDWSDYFAASKQKGRNPFYENVEEFLGEPGDVLELGFGAGLGVLWWLEKGWRVHAVDEDKFMCENLSSLLNPGCHCKIEQRSYIHAGFKKYDVVSAVFSLFFVPPDYFDPTWKKIFDALRPNGLFVGQFLGPHDDWAGDGWTTHTKDEVEKLLENYEILFLDEVERDGETVYGKPKHWHVIHVIARKKM